MMDTGRQYIDTTPGAAFPELREVVPPMTWHRGAQLMNARPEPVTAPPPQPKSYREQLAERISRSPFYPESMNAVLREFSWLRSGSTVERIVRSGRSDAEIALLVDRLCDPRLNLPGSVYAALVAKGHIRRDGQ